jgi:hypothetical protein
MAAINTDLYGAPYSEITLTTAQITVSKRYHTIAAAVGTVGTISTVALDSGIGTQLAGNLTDVYIRPASGHFMAVQHAIPGSDPVYQIGSRTVNLNDKQTLHLVRNFDSNSWLGENGINLTGGVLVDLTSSQQLSNKGLIAPGITVPEIIGSLTHRGIVAGYNGGSLNIGQIGTNIVGVNTGTVLSVTLAAEMSMKLTARVLASKTDHTESLFTEVTGLFRRDISGNIIQVGTTTPITIGTSALAVTLGIDTAAQAANILATGIAGTANFIVDYQYNRLGQA